MKKSIVSRLFALVLCLAVCFALAACGASEETTEPDADTKTHAEQGGSVTVSETVPVSERENTITSEVIDGVLQGRLNLVQGTSTRYFTTNGSITVSVDCGLRTLAGKEVVTKNTDANFALWKREDNTARYIGTVHFTSDNKVQSYTFSGLEADAQYRLSFAGSVAKNRLDGTFNVSGIVSQSEEEEPTANR